MPGATPHFGRAALPTAPITPTVELPDVGGIIPACAACCPFLVVLLALRGLAGDAMAMGTLPAMGASTAAVHHSMPGMDHGTSPSSFLASTVQADSHGTAHGPQGHHTEACRPRCGGAAPFRPSDGTDLHAALTAADGVCGPGGAVRFRLRAQPRRALRRLCGLPLRRFSHVAAPGRERHPAPSPWAALRALPAPSRCRHPNPIF
jgi:hypothetical protein